jgi:hypothetical protein
VGSNSGVDRIDRDDGVIIGDDGINGKLRHGGSGSGGLHGGSGGLHGGSLLIFKDQDYIG